MTEHNKAIGKDPVGVDIAENDKLGKFAPAWHRELALGNLFVELARFVRVAVSLLDELLSQAREERTR